MAVFGGPEIITNGLVLHFDAANAKSFRGSAVNLITNGNFSSGMTSWGDYATTTQTILTSTAIIPVRTKTLLILNILAVTYILCKFTIAHSPPTKSHKTSTLSAVGITYK